MLCEHRAALAYVAAHPLFFPPPPPAAADTHPPPPPPPPAEARVLLASAFTFDPAVGDAFGALAHGATLCLAPRYPPRPRARARARAAPARAAVTVHAIARRMRLLSDLGGCLQACRPLTPGNGYGFRVAGPTPGNGSGCGQTLPPPPVGLCGLTSRVG